MTRTRSLSVTLALCLLLVLVKLWLVLSLADVFFYGEELEKGTAAKAMLDGIGVPHHTLAYHYYEGGGFVVSHLTAALFAVLGENLWAHKLVSIGFDLAILLAGLAFTRRFFGEAAAVAFGLLLVFAPLAFQKLALLNLGIHYEASLFLILVFHFGARLLCDEAPSRRTLALFGLTAGFGTYFNYGILPLVVFWLGVLFVFRPRAILAGRELTLAWSLLLGAAPLLWMWTRVGTEVFDIHGTPLVGAEAEAELEETTGGPAAVLSFARSWSEDSGVFEHALLAVWVLVPVLGGFVLRRRGGACAPRVFGLLVAYFAAFGLVYVASPFAVEHAYHYFLFQRLVPFWMIATLLVAATIGTLLSTAGGPRAAGAALLAVLLTGGIASTLRAVTESSGGTFAENAELLARTKGYTYVEYFAKFHKHIKGGHAQKLAVLVRFREPHPELLYADATEALYTKGDLEPEEVLEHFREVDDARHRLFMPGLGPYLYSRSSGRMKLAIADAVQVPGRMGQTFVEALGRRGLYLYPPPDRLALEAAELAENPPPAPYWRGLGYRTYKAFRLDEPGAEAFIEGLEPKLGRLVREGYGRARELHTLPPTVAPDGP